MTEWRRKFGNSKMEEKMRKIKVKIKNKYKKDRQQAEVCCLVVFGMFQSSQMLAAALFLQFSLLLYC
jgi:hypothetical protein